MSKLRKTLLDLSDFLGRHSGCHRIPERCFTYKGYVFPVCARCTGIFLSMPLALYFAVKKSVSNFLGLFLIPLGVDWGLNYLGVTKGSNKRRFVTGFLGGFAVYAIQIKIIKKIVRLFFRRNVAD